MVAPALILLTVSISLPPQSIARDWEVQVKPEGTIRIVDLFSPSVSVAVNYAEPLVDLDSSNHWVPCLAKDWRWLSDRTIEFKLRQGVTFHNGEKFDAASLMINWEAYRRMNNPRTFRFSAIPYGTRFDVVDQYIVRLTFPKPDGLAFVKLRFFLQIAPAFFTEHAFDERNWAYFPESGPWGTGPFKLVEGNLRFGKAAERVVLKAYEEYWDQRFPKLREVVFENALIGQREEAMRRCMQSGTVDIVSNIRPLDTLKVAESPFAKVVKSKDVSLLCGVFNQQKKGSKWHDIRLRKAVNYAINRDELWKYAAKGNAYNLGGFIPPGAYGYDPSLPAYTYNVSRAKSLLMEAGYPDGFEVRIISHEAWKLELQIIAKMLERIGLKVIPEVLTFPGLLRRVYIPALEKPPKSRIGIYLSATW